MTCAICGKPVDPAYRPFCSRRCADVDLAHWLRGNYAIPVVEDDPDDVAPGEESGDETGDGADTGSSGRRPH